MLILILILIHLQNKSRSGSDKTILNRDNTNINNKTKVENYGKKLFAIECDNVILDVRPNGDTVIVTEATELVLGNAVMEQLVRNSGAYKSFVATKDEIVADLERDNVKLQNEIVGLKEELEHTKADKDKLQKELDDIADSAIQPIAKGYAVNIGNLSQGTLGYIFDIDGNFIADCGTDKRAKRVQYLLQEGKISLDVVMEIFGNTGGKKRRVDDDKVSGEK